MYCITISTCEYWDDTDIEPIPQCSGYIELLNKWLYNETKYGAITSYAAFIMSADRPPGPFALVLPC